MTAGLLRRLAGQDRWDEATRYAPPPPGNGIGGEPCPCGRPHGLLYSDGACDAAYARAQDLRRAAMRSSEERPAWIEGPATITATRRESTVGERFGRAFDAAARAMTADE